MIVGILSVQGGFALHEKKFHALGIQTERIVNPEGLNGLDGLVVPGGESSTMLKNIDDNFWRDLKTLPVDFPVWGTCAGTVMLSSLVENPRQKSLTLMDISVERNSYGTQNESFITDLVCNLGRSIHQSECIFIRAPRIIRVGDTVRILADHEGDPVMVEQGKRLATTFHPELGEGVEFHRYFVEKIVAV